MARSMQCHTDHSTAVNSCPSPYHERQSLLHCGIHTLNNLFQSQSFTKQQLDEGAEHLAKLNPEKSLFNPHKSVLGIGNYDINVLIHLLQCLSYEVIWFDRRKSLDKINYKELFGIIMNETHAHFFGWYKNQHWYCVKYLENSGSWINLDSKLQQPVVINNIQTFLQQQIKQANDAHVLLVVAHGTSAYTAESSPNHSEDQENKREANSHQINNLTAT
jgi:josephin